MKRRTLILTILLVVILFPLWMWLGWILTGKKDMRVLVFDKTVNSDDMVEHTAFFWVLNYDKYAHGNKLYNHKKDYLGFYPGKDKKFTIKDLEDFDSGQIDSLADHYDAVQISDLYGVYHNEWYRDTLENERSPKIYGGMTREEAYLLKEMKARNKLILAEFNMFESPTAEGIRSDMESTFGFKWSKWVGRYFHSLDTSKNEDIPHWAIRNYKNQHGGQWPFKKAGIIFVDLYDRVEVLEDERDMIDPVPVIVTRDEAREYFDLPREMKFPYWFSVLSSVSHPVHADHLLNTNERGDSILASMGISRRFPAVFGAMDPYPFYYLAGDFSDNPVDLGSSRFKGVRFFQFLFFDSTEDVDRKKFFWMYYYPLVSKILEDYYERIDHEGRGEPHMANAVK